MIPDGGCPQLKYAIDIFCRYLLRKLPFSATVSVLVSFARPAIPVLAMGFADDLWATPTVIDLLVGQLVNCQTELRQIQPQQGAIGHMGFFRRKHQHTLWPALADWLEQQLVQPAAAALRLPVNKNTGYWPCGFCTTLASQTCTSVKPAARACAAIAARLKPQ